MYKIKLGTIEFHADVPSPHRDVVEFATGFRSEDLVALLSKGDIVDISIQEVGSDQARTGRGKLTAWDLGVGGSIAFEQN